jgi:hypothetical protein
VKNKLSSRLSLIASLLAVAVFVALIFSPVSTRLTRAVGLLAVFIIWRGVIGLVWRWRTLRMAALGLTGICASFLLLPERGVPAADRRGDYTAALRQYDRVRYHWGGESRTGIDCSGLVRRGLIDAMAWRGLRTANGGLVRRALVHWWNDTSADALGSGHAGLTIPLFNAESINTLDQSRLEPGDLAVTTNGVHIMAFLGGNEWIEADPGIGRVISVAVPADNRWFKTEMRLVRWRVLAGD